MFFTKLNILELKSPEHKISGLFSFCIKKTMRYAYGSEKVLPLSKKTSHHARIYIGQPTKIFNTRRCFLMSSDTNSLAHTKWNCKYHIVFAPKYRRQVIYGKSKEILELFYVNYVKEKVYK